MFEGKLDIEGADQMFKCSHSAVISTSGLLGKTFSYIFSYFLLLPANIRKMYIIAPIA